MDVAVSSSPFVLNDAVVATCVEFDGAVETSSVVSDGAVERSSVGGVVIG